MAAGRIPRPGTEYGPCKEECEHHDCATQREMSSHRCMECGDPIGYDTAFFEVVDADPTHYVHESCELERIKAESAA